VPPIESFLEPPQNEPPDWTKEIVTEIRGRLDGKVLTYRMGTLTCKGALPTGVAPAIAAIWLAEGRIDPGVYPPEAALEPEPFFKELEERQIYTQATVTQRV
jgi:saccharopine dehydrogenase-like NADP-dependent oxidoreductase